MQASQFNFNSQEKKKKKKEENKQTKKGTNNLFICKLIQVATRGEAGSLGLSTASPANLTGLSSKREEQAPWVKEKLQTWHRSTALRLRHDFK